MALPPGQESFFATNLGERDDALRD